MAGVVEHPDIGALQRLAEFLDREIEAGLVQIELRAIADQREAEPLQGRRHQHGVVARVLQSRHILIGRVADHQRNAPVGQSRERDDRNGERRRDQQHDAADHQ